MQICIYVIFFLNYLDREKAASAEAVLQLRPVYNIHHYINKLLN